MKFFIKSSLVNILALTSLFTLHSQAGNTNNAFRVLKVGDTVPPFIINASYHQQRFNKSLPALTNKLLIIDFWATWCGTCLAGFTKIENIKQQVGDGFSVLPVTYEEEAMVNTFIQRRKRFGKPDLQTGGIYGDTILQKLFPHESLPHYVWIGKGGIVKAITGYNELTIENVRAAMNNESQQLKAKDDKAANDLHNINLPLFIKGNGGNGDNIIWYSLVSGKTEGLLTNTRLVAGNKQGFLQIPNTDVYTLFRFAYGDDPEFDDVRLPSSRLFFTISDSSAYFRKDSDDPKLASGQLYSYNLVTPPMPMNNVKKIMQEDMKRYFRLAAHWETRLVNCLVLTAEDTSLIKPVPDSSLDINAVSSSDLHFVSRNNPVKYFVRALSQSYLFDKGFTIIDETGYTGKSYFSIEADMGDWRSVDAALAKYKMHLKLEKRMLPVLIVTQNTVL